MAYVGQTTQQFNKEQLGSFSGYIRRPIPTVSGLTAQVFGENGEDADTILALSLTKYQDAQVFVNIYLIKDANGKIMKENNKYPLISSFIGFLRRSQPKKEGMIAQIFATNGVDADEVSNLNKSLYQDCLVYVDIRGNLTQNQKEQIILEDNEEIEKKYINKITKHQKDDYIRRSKQFRKMNEILELSDFLYKLDVMMALGKGTEFKEWLQENKSCSYQTQDMPCSNPHKVVEIPGLLKPFNYLPTCDEHESEMINFDQEETNQGLKYYEMKHRFLLKEWVWKKLCQNFSINSDPTSEPDPSLIIDWAMRKGLDKYLPKKYQPVL
jgi:hypothetical protein